MNLMPRQGKTALLFLWNAQVFVEKLLVSCLSMLNSQRIFVGYAHPPVKNVPSNAVCLRMTTA